MLSLARWSIAHRRLVVGVWLVVLVASLGLATGVGNRFVNNLTLPHTDAERATALLKSHFPQQSGDSDQIVFHARSGTIKDARFFWSV